MAAKKPGAQATVTLKHLAANLSEAHEMSKKQTEAVLGDLVGLVTKHLKKGDRIRIGGLGILVVRKRAARMGRNPATGEPIQIKASRDPELQKRLTENGTPIATSTPEEMRALMVEEVAAMDGLVKTLGLRQQ